MKKITTFILSFIGFYVFFIQTSKANDLINSLNVCQNETSPLVRLDCYDSVLLSTQINSSENSNKQIKPMSQSAKLALKQESERKTSTNNFIITNSGGNNPSIVITTEAIGIQPPRPILAFSCIDNITRMQLIFSKPLNSQENRIKLKTDKNEISSIWFIRDGNFTIEASRGLPGIQEILQILPSKSLQIFSENKEINRLYFNIEGLSTAINPLRTACRW